MIRDFKSLMDMHANSGGANLIGTAWKMKVRGMPDDQIKTLLSLSNHASSESKEFSKHRLSA